MGADFGDLLLVDDEEDEHAAEAEEGAGRGGKK